MDYLDYYSLNEDPFKLTPDPSFFYPSVSHNEGVLLMDYSVDQKEGFLLVIGDPGTGKTTLLNVFLEKWKDRAEIAIVLTPRLSPEEFLCAVAEDFHIDIRNKNKNGIIKSLRSFLAEKASEGKRVIIIVDEAQNLPDETLEELRLLSNIETDKDKLLHITLIGQPELEDKLHSVRLRQLNQRISTRVHLQHFNSAETLEYINYRIIKAGKTKLQVHRKVGSEVFTLTNGIPRLINMLMSRALMASYLEESNLVEPRHVKHAVKSLGHSDLNVRGLVPTAPLLAGIAALVITAGLVLFYLNGKSVDKVPAGSPVSGDTSSVSNALPSPTGPYVASDSSISDQGSENSSSDRPVKYRDLAFISVTTDVAPIRNEPSFASGRAGWSLQGDRFVVLSESIDDNGMVWYKVSFQDSERWVSGNDVNYVTASRR